MSEAELISGCIKESRMAQRALYDRFSGKMYSVCLRYTGEITEAEDVLQEGFIKVFDNITKFRNEGSLEGWVRKIMVNTALQHLKKSRNSLIDSRADAYGEMEDYVNDEAFDILNRISAAEIVKMISQLPAGYRTVFNLYIIDGYSHKEIAEMIQINESTSRSQLVKARNMLQTKIKMSTVIYHEQ